MRTSIPCPASQVSEKLTSCTSTLQQSSPCAFPWDKTITIQFAGAHLFSIQPATHRQQQSLLMTFDDTKANIWNGRTRQSVKSMFLIDFMEQKQSLPCISPMKSSTETQPAYYSLYESFFCGQARCQDLVTGIVMERRWLSLPSGRIMSSGRDTGPLVRIEACPTAKQEQNKLCLYFFVCFGLSSYSYSLLQHAVIRPLIKLF